MKLTRKTRIFSRLGALKALSGKLRLRDFAVSLVTILGLTTSLTLGLAACTLRSPPSEAPLPDSVQSGGQGIEKTFFVDKVVENAVVEQPRYDEKGRMIAPAKYEKTAQLKSKTFLCAWAPITETGAFSQQLLTHGVNMANHCNVEFEITEPALIGKLVNPSFPNDRSRWKTVLWIPITKHYYREKSKDSYGRDTKEEIKNDKRSDFSARPLMDLDLSGLRIQDWDFALFLDARTGSVNNVEDVEWDRERNFLGFTLNVTSPEFGTLHQGRIRFNFLRFEHNPEFKATPYDGKNARYLNALHILGEKVEGVSQVLYAAHWDLNKRHKIYLHGFTDSLIPIAQKTIDAWNHVLSEKLGLPPAFELSTENKNKYGFDLRYPSLVWVADPAIQLGGTLGIGTALADVKNGELLWGNVTVYGGQYESYIKRFLPTGDISGAQSMKSSMLQIAPLGSGFFTVPNNLFSGSALKAFDVTGSSHGALARHIETERPGTGQRFADAIISDIEQTNKRVQSHVDLQVGKKPISKLLGFPTYEREAAEKILGTSLDKMSGGEFSSNLTRKAQEKSHKAGNSVVFDTDRRFIDVAPGWASAIAASKGQLSYDKAFEKVVRDIFLHEFGHIIGLGHQFKENIIPADGTVPAKYITKLKERAKQNMTNATSVMGYKNPMTELLTDDEDLMPGPQDELVLRYLYKQEYPVFKKNSAGDFQFLPMPANGIIPARSPKDESLETTFFPQCNDFQASTASDPFCNRHDRGYNAETIIKGYFDDINSNLVSRIYAFTDARGGNAQGGNSYMWYKALNNFGRIRLFYDYMRDRYADEIQSISGDEQSLYEFSRACSGEIPASAKLHALFRTRDAQGREVESELGQLCRANRMAIQEFTTFMINPGPDRTRMDWDNASAPASISGGDADIDYGRMWGTYTALSVLPLKLSAMNALTTSRPYFFYGPWMLPVPRFDDEKGLFSYSSLYPFEFTKAMAKAVEKNMKFGTAKDPKTTLGEPVLALGYYLDQMNDSNDPIRLPKDFIETIRTQNNFRLSMVAVLMSLKGREEKTPYITHFDTSIFDFRTGRNLRGSQAFVLPGGKVIVKGPNRSFVFPITKFTFLDDAEGYVLAYRIDFDEKHDDVLAAHSAKNSLKDLHEHVIKSCFYGDSNNGLANFFNRETPQKDFPGFEAFPGIANDKEMQLRFLDSVEVNFKNYYAFTGGKVGPEACEQALKGLGLIVTGAAAVSGYWLPQTSDYLVK